MKKMTTTEMKNVAGGYTCGCCGRSFRLWISYACHAFKHYRKNGNLC